MKKLESVFSKIGLGGLLLLGINIFYLSCKTMRKTSRLMEMKLGYAPFRVMLIVLGIIIIGSFMFYNNKLLMKVSEKRAFQIAVAAFAAIVILQLLYTLFITKAYPRSDNNTVLTYTMDMARKGQFILNNHSGYFADYTNNYFITFFLYGFFRIMLFFGIDNLWNAVIVLNVFMIDLTIIVSFFTVKKIRGVRHAAVLMIFILICPTTYEWLTYTYTNTLGLPFGALLLYMSIRYEIRENKCIQVGYIVAMSVIAAIGYLLRATIIIQVLASSIYLIFKVSHMEIEDKKAKHIMVTVGTFLVCFFFCTKTIIICENQYLTDTTKAKRLPITHWIMMGLGENGGFNGADLAYTKQFDTYEEKKEANIKVIKERISDKNLISLMQKKLTRVWADGSDECFSYNERDTKDHYLFRYINGNRNLVFAVYVQAFRAVTFLGIIFAVSSLLWRKNNLEEFLFALTLFGAIMFFILWEANVKYSISFIFVLLMLLQYGIASAEEYIDNSSQMVQIRVHQGALGVCLLLIAANVIVSIHNIDAFTEKKVMFNNFIFNGTRKNETKYTDGVIGDNVLTQTFTTDKAFNKVNIMCKPLKDGDVNTKYTMILSKENGKELLRKDFTTKNVKSKNIVQFKCKEKEKSKEQTYSIKIQKAPGQKDSLLIGQVKSNEFDYIPNGTLKIGTKESNNDMFLEVYDQTKETYTSKWMYGIVTSSIIILQICIAWVLWARLKLILKQS